jgi:hypothetical protein
MKIVSMHFEIVRATSAVAEFIVRVELDEPTANCGVTGRITGPKCPGVSTVEVTYHLRLVESSGRSISFRGAVPEPNLWKPETPFTYVVGVDLQINGKVVDSHDRVVSLKHS